MIQKIVCLDGIIECRKNIERIVIKDLRLSSTQQMMRKEPKIREWQKHLCRFNKNTASGTPYKVISDSINKQHRPDQLIWRKHPS